MIKKIIIAAIIILAVFGLLILPEKFNPLYLLLFVPILGFGIKKLRK